MNGLTEMLYAAARGDAGASDEMFRLVYDELRQMAAHKMASEPAGHTLQPTALVHEAWLRLVGDEMSRFETRGHFFAAAAEAMRRILIERARRKQSLKRGAEFRFESLNLEHADVAIHTNDDTLLVVDEALEKLNGEDPDSARLIKLRFFAGMTNEEAGRAMGISERTAKRHWAFARAWLYEEIRRQA